MANQKMLALVFALATSVVHADNCARIYPFASLKTDYATRSCPSDSMTCTKTGSFGDADHTTTCSCGDDCCEVKADTCAKLGAAMGGAQVCGADRTQIMTESGLAASTTAATFDTDCCTAKPLCSSMSSCTQAGYKKNAANDNVKCMATTCTDGECCMVDPDKCLGVAFAGNLCGADREIDATKYGNAATAADYDTNCCKASTCAGIMFMNACGANRLYDSSQDSTAATAANYDTNCCKAAPQCSSITCTSTAGYMDNTAVAGTHYCSTDPCTAAECCSVDPTKCLGFPTANVIPAAKHCDTSDPPTTAPGDFLDSSKNGNTVADVDSFKSTCCKARASCTDFKNHAYSGSADGAERMHKPATGLLILLTIAALAFAK